MNRAAVLLFAAGCGDNLAAGGDFASGTRLQLVTYELSDGTSAVDHDVFHDKARDEDCTIVRFSSGARFCMPTNSGGTTFFTESSCTRVVGAVRSDREPPAYVVRLFALGGEVLPSRLYPVGAPIAAPPGVWEQQESFCVGPYMPDPALAFYEVGDAVTTDDLVAVRATDEIAAGRLTITVDTSDDGWRAPGTVTDAELALPCSLASAPDAATTTCVPALPPVSYYADAACREPLVADDIALHRDHASACATVVERGEAYTGAVFEQIDDNCVAVPAPADALYRAGVTHELASVARSDEGNHRVHPIILGEVLHDRLLRDTGIGADCALVDGVCAPVSTVDVRTYFSDEQCSTPIDVAFVPTGACDLPAHFASGRRIGDVHAGTIYELTTGDRCAAYTPPARFTVHVAGDAPTDLVTFERQR